MVPILKELPTNVYSLDEQLHRAAAELRDLRSQHAIVKLPERPSAQVKIATVDAPFACAERIQRFVEASFIRCSFAQKREEADAESEARLHELERRASGSNTRDRRDGNDFLE